VTREEPPGTSNNPQVQIVLFVSQRDHMIDAHGAARGDVAGDERDQREHNGDGRKCNRVVRVQAIQHARNETRNAERRSDSDGCADEHEQNSLTDDNAQQHPIDLRSSLSRWKNLDRNQWR